MRCRPPTKIMRYSLSQRGQAMAEFALVLPLLVLLLVGMTLAGFYGFHSASADTGVFLTGVAEGVYNLPATAQARRGVLWEDIRGAFRTGPSGAREVRSRISILESRMTILGVDFKEAQSAETHFRLWRFYPGPPQGDIE